MKQRRMTTSKNDSMWIFAFGNLDDRQALAEFGLPSRPCRWKPWTIGPIL